MKTLPGRANAPVVGHQGDADEGLWRPYLTRNGTTARQDSPIYDPTGVRKCAVCSHVDRWQRIIERGVPGGFYCCTAPRAETFLEAMRHTCSSTLCAHGKGAA
jgi:hypothetical protein